MIDLYYYPTPNSLKITIYCEEAGLPYRIIPLDLPGGAHKEPAYLKINPNAQMPAIIDHDGPGGGPYQLFESGAILMYLAEKTGLFMPRDIRGRYDVIGAGGRVSADGRQDSVRDRQVHRRIPAPL
jgi:GST-like protein